MCKNCELTFEDHLAIMPALDLRKNHSEPIMNEYQTKTSFKGESEFCKFLLRKHTDTYESKLFRKSNEVNFKIVQKIK